LSNYSHHTSNRKPGGGKTQDVGKTS